MEHFLAQYAKIKRHHKIIISILTLIALLYFGYENEVVPADAQLVSAKDAANGLENEIATLKDLTQSMVVIQDNLKRAQQEMDEIKAKLPEQPDLEGLLASLSDAAKSAGVTIVSFEPKEHTSSGDANSGGSGQNIPGGPGPAAAPQSAGTTGASGGDEALAFKTNIDVKVSGTFSQIVLFYDKTLHFDRIIHLTRFELASADQSNSTQQEKMLLNASATFVAYSQLAKAIPRSDTAKQQTPQTPQTPPPAQAPQQSATDAPNNVSENRSPNAPALKKQNGPLALADIKPKLRPEDD